MMLCAPWHISLCYIYGQHGKLQLKGMDSWLVPLLDGFVVWFGFFFFFVFFLKFWDYRQPRKYLNILPCQVPVWKARYTVSEKHPPAPLVLWEQIHEGMLNKELLQCFLTLLLDVTLILKSLMVLTRPRKAMSAMGAFGRRNHWQCEIPVFSIILLGIKLRCEWLTLGAGGLESSCCSCCPIFSFMSSTGTCRTDICPL